MRYNHKLDKYTTDDDTIYPEKTQILLKIGVKEAWAKYPSITLIACFICLALFPLIYLFVKFPELWQEFCEEFLKLFATTKSIWKA